MIDDTKRNHEREIKHLQDQIEANRTILENKTLSLSLLEQQIEGLYHDIFQKNNVIQAIENEEKDQFKDDAARKQFEAEVKQEQQEQLLKTKFQKTSEKSRMLVEEFYLNKHKALSEKFLNQQVKLDVQSVKIMYLKGDPSEYLEKNSRNSTTIQFVVQTFSINKQTLIKDLFDTAIEYFQVSSGKRDDHVLTDTNFNDLTLIYDYPAESFFSSQKESCLYAEMYLKPKYALQQVLLDKQQKSIQTTEEAINKQNSDDTEKKNFNTIFSNFEKVFSGIQLYSISAKDDQNMMVQQKVQPRFWLNIFHTILYIVVIALIVGRLRKNNDPNIYNLKANCQYFLQTFSNNSDPIIDDTFFQQSLNRFSRKFQLIHNKIDAYPNNSGFISLGSTRIIIKRTKKIDCNVVDEYEIADDQVKKDCSHPILTEENEEKETYNGKEWSSASTTKLDDVKGFLGTYEGGGYMFDFDPYISEESAFYEATNKLQSYIDFQTKVIIMYQSFYDVNWKTFMVIYQYNLQYIFSYYFNQSLIIKCKSSLLLALSWKIKISNKMSANSQDSFRTSIVCIIMVSIIFVISIFVNGDKTYQIYKINQEQKLKMRTRDIYFNMFSFQIIAEIAILVMIIISHVYIYDVPSESFDSIIKTVYPNFVNIHKYGKQQELGYNLCALSLIILVLFVCINIPLNQEIKSYQRMIQNSVSPLIVVLILIFTLICAIALVLQRVYGPHIVEFSTYEDAFYETIFVYLFGDYQIQELMWEKHEILAICMIGVVVLTLFYGSFGLFNSVLYEKYRLVSTKLKFQVEQQQDVAGELNEKLKNLSSISCWKCFKKSDKSSAPKKPKKTKPAKTS